MELLKKLKELRNDIVFVGAGTDLSHKNQMKLIKASKDVNEMIRYVDMNVMTCYTCREGRKSLQATGNPHDCKHFETCQRGFGGNYPDKWEI